MDTASSLLLKLWVQVRVCALESDTATRSMSFSSEKLHYRQANALESASSPLHHSHQERATFYSPPLSVATSSNTSFSMSSYSMNDFVPRYHATRLSHQFLLLVAATAKLSLVKHCIIDKYQKLYPQEPPLKIQCLRDRNNCDLDDDYMAIEIFSSNDVLKVIRLQGETDTMKPEACETSNAFPPQTLPTKSNQELVKIEKTEPPSSCFSSQSLEATSAEHESKSFLSVSSLSSSASLASSDLDDDETTHAPASFQQTVSAEPESDGESTSYKSSSTEQEDSEPDTDEDVDPDPDPDGDNVRRALEAKYEEERKTEDSVSVLKRKFTGDSDSDSDSDGESELTSHQQTTIIHQNDHDSHSDRHETESELEFESLEECAPSALLTNTNQGPFLVTQAPHTLFQKESMPSAPDPLHRSSFSSPFLSSPLGYGSKTDKRANVKNIKEESSAAHRLTKVKEEAPENDGHDASETSSDSSSSDDESSSRRSLASLPSLKSMKINKPSVPPPVVVTVQKPNTAHAKPVIAKKPLAKKAYSAAIFSSN